MDDTPTARLVDHFQVLTDSRDLSRVTYPLINFVMITICAVLSGADDFVSIAGWAKAKRDWLETFFDLDKGIPSHDRFNAIFAALKPEEFERCLTAQIKEVVDLTDGQVIAIDGKTLRRSYDRKSSKAATDEKSNEINAIPKLLKLLEIRGVWSRSTRWGAKRRSPSRSS